MINISLTTIVCTVIDLLILTALMKIFLFKPVMNAINEREERIKNQFDQARSKEAQADQLKQEYTERLEHASKAAEEIVTQAKERANLERDQILDNARKTSEQIIEKSKKSAEAERKKVAEDAQADIAKLAIAAARKIIKSGGNYDAKSGE